MLPQIPQICDARSASPDVGLHPAADGPIVLATIGEVAPELGSDAVLTPLYEHHVYFAQSVRGA